MSVLSAAAVTAAALVAVTGAQAVTYDTLNPPGTDLSVHLRGQNNTPLGGTDGMAGFAVDNAGDVNGDGDTDYLVSAPTSDNNSRTDSGSVFVIYGKPGQASLRNVNLGDLAPEDGYRIDGPDGISPLFGDAPFTIGFDVANAGDVNGDGVPDQIISAPLARDPEVFEQRTGAVWIVYGRRGNAGPFAVPSGAGPTSNCLDLASTQPACTPFFDVTNPGGYRIDGGMEEEANTGWAVANAGDVNADGVPDQLIGAPGRNVGLSGEAGFVWVVYGRRAGVLNPPPVANLSIRLEGAGGGIEFNSAGATDGYLIHGADALSRAGTSLANAGDVNGDGIPDQIVGSRGSPLGRSFAGSYYVVYGRRNGTGVPVPTGAPYVVDLSGALMPPGTVQFNSAAGYRIDGAASNDLAAAGECTFGIASAGDVNGDGVPDQLLGAPGVDAFGRINVGAAYIVYGRRAGQLPPPMMVGVNLVDLAGATPNAVNFGPGAGYRIVGAASQTNNGGCGLGGDVTKINDPAGDGVPEAVVTDFNHTADWATRVGNGTVYYLYGRRAGSTLPTPTGNNTIDLGATDGAINFDKADGYKAVGPRDQARLGHSVADIGDVSGDGRPDVLIGAIGDWNAATSVDGRRGSVFVLKPGPAGGSEQPLPPGGNPGGNPGGKPDDGKTGKVGDPSKQGGGAGKNCVKPTIARRLASVSQWQKFGRFARVRLRGPINGYVIKGKVRKVNVSVFRFGVNVGSADFALDGKKLGTSRGSRPRTVLDVESLAPGRHEVVAQIRAKRTRRTARNNAVLKRHVVTARLRFLVLPCPPATFTVRQSKKRFGTPFQLRMTLRSGGPSINSARFELPVNLASGKLAKRVPGGRSVGKVVLIGKGTKSISLRTPRTTGKRIMLSSKGAAATVVLVRGSRSRLEVTGVPDGFERVTVALLGRRGRWLENTRVGLARYNAALGSGTGAQSSSLRMASGVKVYKRSGSFGR